MSETFRSEIVENQKARVDLVKWKLIIVAAVFAWSLDKGAGSSQQLSFWVISMVPFVCLFVDCQSFHINLRTLVIGHFLRIHKSQADEGQYEAFVHGLRTGNRSAGGRQNANNSGSKRQWLLPQVLELLRGDMFQLEQGVLTLSTLGLCVVVLFWPNVAQSFEGRQDTQAPVTTAALEKSAPSGSLVWIVSPAVNASPSTKVGLVGNKSGRRACRVTGIAGLILSSLLFWRYHHLKEITTRAATASATG